MPLLKRAAAFDDPDWLFELKYDGFRAFAVIEHGCAQLLSRNGHPAQTRVGKATRPIPWLNSRLAVSLC